jgi:hypothetical protein
MHRPIPAPIWAIMADQDEAKMKGDRGCETGRPIRFPAVHDGGGHATAVFGG